jgi:hypothetical protein
VTAMPPSPDPHPIPSRREHATVAVPALLAPAVRLSRPFGRPSAAVPGTAGRVLVAALLVLGSFAPFAGPARSAPKAVSGRFSAPDTSGRSTVRGVLTGRDYRDHALRVGAGQAIVIEMSATRASAFFNVLPPGSQDVAMFVGSTSGSRFEGIAPVAGDYVVRTYLMRSAARRGVSTRYSLTARVRGRALVPLPSREDARVPGTAYHATTRVRCAVPFRPGVESCDAGVIRYARDGTATVVITAPGGFVRRLLFVRGRLKCSDSAEPAHARSEGDTIEVSVGDDERYEIPGSLLTGG